MIAQLLGLLEEGRSGVGIEELARRLDATPAAVEGALELLVRKGRLFRGSPSGACGACAAQTMCNPLQGQTTRYFQVPAGARPLPLVDMPPACGRPSAAEGRSSAR